MDNVKTAEKLVTLASKLLTAGGGGGGGEYGDEGSNSEAWLKQHGLPTDFSWGIELPGDEDSGDSEHFHLRLESLGIGNKNWIPKEKEAKLIAWLKLTAELFHT